MQAGSPMKQTSPGPALPSGFRDLANRYDLILCDVWGVIHNGIVAFPEAAEALMRFRAGGGHVLLLSNAPRPGLSVATQLDKLGVPRAAYDAIVTSGDASRAMVEERLGQVLHHIGPPRDAPLFEGLPVRFGTVEEADYVLCSGLDDDETETEEDYRPRLEKARARNLPLICANPDLVVERGPRLIPCAGALALMYERMGGEAIYAGKPHRLVYERAVNLATLIRGRAVDPSRIIGIGDAIRTDVTGAMRFGIHSLFIAAGIHGAELGLHGGALDEAVLNRWLEGQEAQPNAAMTRLVWG